MSKLILVGVSHADLKGPERLRKLLEYEKPDHICLEATQNSFNHGVKVSNGVKEVIENNPEHVFGLFGLKDNKEFERAKIIAIQSYYEDWVSKEYISKNPNVQITFIDKKVSQRVDDLLESTAYRYALTLDSKSKKVPFFDMELRYLAPTLIRNKSLFTRYQSLVDEDYSNSSNQLMIEVHGQYVFDKIMTRRDLNFARRIRKLREKNPDRNLLAILGNQHIFGNQENNVYDRLRNLKPTRLRLVEADSI